jgi:hypothetical protein
LLKTLLPCHSEERGDEKSLFSLAFVKERFLAALGIKGSELFFNKLLVDPIGLNLLMFSESKPGAPGSGFGTWV